MRVLVVAGPVVERPIIIYSDEEQRLILPGGKAGATTIYQETVLESSLLLSSGVAEPEKRVSNTRSLLQYVRVYAD